MMRSGKRILVLLMTLMLLVCCLSHAAMSGRYCFVNNLETSAVDVAIKQYCVDADGREMAAEKSIVMPGQTISYIPRVINKGADSFVRVSFDFENDGMENARPVTLGDVGKVSDEWIQKGNCFYCTRIMRNGERSDVFREISVPECWDSPDVKGFGIKAKVDAVQAKNFSPDFERLNPWGSIEIQESAKQGQNAVRHAKARERLELTYTEAGTFECSTSDLFSDFDILMPGDEYSKKLPMRNRSGKAMDVYFRTDNDSSMLKEETNLTISCEDRVIYKGNLSSEKLGSFIKLTRITAGANKDIEFSISLPRDADNRFSGIKDDVIWIFAVKEVDDESDSNAVKTGDAIGNMLVVLATICTLMVIIITLVILKGGRNG